MVKLLVALTVLATQFYVLYFMRTDPVIPERSTFAEFPMQVDGWRCSASEEISDEIMEKLQATDYFSCLYSRVGEPEPAAAAEPVHLYIGYHAQQARSGGAGAGAIHPPEHCLPGSGWDIIDASVVPMTVGGRDGEAKRFVIAKGNERNLVYFWYDSRGRVVARSHEKIFYTFLDRALTGRTDGALVRLTVRVGGEGLEEADETVARFKEAVGPELGAFLPH